MTTFDAQVCAPVRAHLGRAVRLPSVGTWDVSRVGGVPTLSFELPRVNLGENLQTHRPAAPFFLTCFAWWYARLTGADPALHVSLTGDAPTGAGAVRHMRRALIALEALREALGSRLTIDGMPSDLWPRDPVLNAPRQGRGHQLGGKGREHMVEVQLTAEPEHAAALPGNGEAIAGFRRQLPLGLFDGEVSRKTHWTPGQGAQADLWATSPDGATFHLFELKVGGNTSVGILPELLVYLWLVHRARQGFADGRRVRGGGEGIEAARRAERVVGWTLAPDLHPLLGSKDGTPLTWLAEGLRGRLTLGMLFYREVSGSKPFGGWHPAQTWRSAAP